MERAAQAAEFRELLNLALIPGVANPSLEEGGEWEMEMKAQATKLQAAEDELKQLMADVSRAMRKLRKLSRG